MARTRYAEIFANPAEPTPARSKPRKSRQSRKPRSNPFWVTPAGTAVHQKEDDWKRYTVSHGGVRLPPMAEREALLERQPEQPASGWSIQMGHVTSSNGLTQTVYRLYYQGNDTGKYAMERRKAVEITHSTDPLTGKRRKNA